MATEHIVEQITKQGIYKCNACGQEGPANSIAQTPWRWYHYLTIFLFFPFGLIFTLTTTASGKECAKCHSRKIKRLRYESLPKPSHTDPGIIRNGHHRKIALWVFGGVYALSFIIGLAVGFLAPSEDVEQIQETTMPANDTPSTEIDAVGEADYLEGYKAGYADGRVVEAQVGDSYLPPATVERKENYTTGYLDGVLVGCQEAGLDCSELERDIAELSNGSEDAQLLQ